LKQALKEIALFVAIAPAFAAWVPLVIFMVMVITREEFGLTILYLWFVPGYWLMRLFGFTEHDLSSGGDFMRLPSDLAVKGVLTLYSVIGLMVWMTSLYIRRMMRRPLWR
jgi:hypothetical protein